MKLTIYSILIICYFISFWKIFEKAGRKPWEGIVPFYNIFIWLKIIKKPWWWLFLLLFPGVNVLMIIVMNVNIANVFGKRSFTDSLLMIAVPFLYLPYIGYTAEVKYVGPIEKKKRKRSASKEWGDAIIFAVVAASIIRTYFIEAFTIPTSSMEKTLLIGDYLFVSKMNYGPKIPQTPLSFPFAHHTMPLTESVKSYLEWMDLPYFRLPGFADIERNDIVVFNFPAGDTVVVDEQARAYEQIVREKAAQVKGNDMQMGKEMKSNEDYLRIGRTLVLNSREITVRPVDKRENYIKRCVGVPGDKLEVVNAKLFINDEVAFIPEMFQFNYLVNTTNSLGRDMLKEDFDMNYQDMRNVGNNRYFLPMTLESHKKLKQLASVTDIEPAVAEKGNLDVTHRIFPNDVQYDWTEDFFGPVVIPKKGETVTLNTKTLPLYRRIIHAYEGHELSVKGDKIFIDGKQADSYTFGMNYYLMMGDSRHNSADGRFFGFVPEDHIVGKAVFIWFSKDKDKGWFQGIRWGRMFSFIH